ncbi:MULTISPECIES: AAA family ATPase [Gordonia]|uniref:AAA family ATPase n=1 Tax=Gordonia TaxID=2053 RepID=UPI0010F4B98A|nr:MULTISPECIES: AAA family ATPase [Gordonia]UPG66345.1 AAA family ATPase [Gordonia hongkongensis]
MRLSAEAMNAALADFQSLQYSTQDASAYEAFLSAKWVHANQDGALPSFSNIGLAVPEVFTVLPEIPLGRLAPFRYDWKTVEGTGRKTVWNNNSRGGNKKSLTLFANHDIRGGLLPDAAVLLGALLPAEKPAWQSLAVLILLDHEFAEGDDWSVAKVELLNRLGLSQAELDAITSQTPLGVPLLGQVEWDATTIPESLGPPESVVVQAPSTQTTSAPRTAPTSVSVDPRVERMLRLAIKTTASILLVGPPGTGKGTLLKWALTEISKQPEAFGFADGFAPDPMWRTPDESWTSFELIGGLAPDPTDGKLRWTPGALLSAIDEDRWLILDETNRGDMDKIMGPLLTWLSDQEVEVGRSETHGGTAIHIGWGKGQRSTVIDDPDQLRYLAGTDFRLFGTYNPQDAQRVFRFGQALSRRFVVIPVPAIKPGQFTQLLEETFVSLAADAVAAISGLYAAHLADSATALGPAVFLRMASYLLAGLPPTPDDAVWPAEDSEGVDTPLLSELLAEAYVMGVGRYLAGFDDRTFDALQERIVTDENGLPHGQWIWVAKQRNVLS